MGPVLDCPQFSPASGHLRIAMEEVGGELGRPLKVFLLNLWKSLNATTQHWIEAAVFTMLAVALVAAAIKDLAKAPFHDPSIVRGIWAVWCWLRAHVSRANAMVISAVALLIFASFGSWPYNFYILTRIVVCVAAAWIAIRLHFERPFCGKFHSSLLR